MDAMEYQMNGLTVVDEGSWDAREQLVARMVSEMERIRDEARKSWMDTTFRPPERVWVLEYYIAQLLETNIVMQRILGVSVRNSDEMMYADELYDQMNQWRMDARQGRHGGK